MPPPGFQWDPNKARTNLARHRVSFEVATLAFRDAHRLVRADDREDYGEDRWLCIAMVAGRIISVCYTERDADIRIISARRAERHEQDAYFVRPT